MYQVLPSGVSAGSLPAIKVIIEIAGRECMELRDFNNRTPLILATMGGHGEVVNCLLAEGGIGHRLEVIQFTFVSS